MGRTSPLQIATALADAMSGDATVAAERWAESGAMALTGASDSPPSATPARVALAADGLAAMSADLSGRVGREVSLDGSALLGERAAIAGLRRRGSQSCGGSTRLLSTADGWIALSLARPADIALLDPWLGARLDVRSSSPFDDWQQIVDAVARRRRRDLIEAATLLGLPCSSLGEMSTTGPLVQIDQVGTRTRRPRSIDGLKVVDLSSLWAGPVCAQLLGDAGGRVVKVESEGRPDGARYGPPAFFDLLHAGHESVAIDFADEGGRRWLRRLLSWADVVIEASRPRALAALGSSFDDLRASGWSGLWVSITGYGRDGTRGHRVAFGDDAAVAGGLVCEVDGAPMFCADAVADPLTGMLAAVSALACLEQGVNGMVSISLARTAASVADGVRRHPPPEGVTLVAAPPRARTSRGQAPCLGAHTDEVLRTL